MAPPAGEPRVDHLLAQVASAAESGTEAPAWIWLNHRNRKVLFEAARERALPGSVAVTSRAYLVLRLTP